MKLERRNFLVPVITGLLLTLVLSVSAQFKKSNLNVLYVGGTTDYQMTEYANKTREQIDADAKVRMASFQGMLKKYFNKVTVMHARDYKQALSAKYDVTVMDGVPGSKLYESKEDLKSIRFVAEQLNTLTEDFSEPMLFIGETGYNLGIKMGLRFDWYCLCLESEAYNRKAGHEIFSKPFPVNITTKPKPLPFDAKHVNFREDKIFPDMVDMWQVQTKSYKGEFKRAGLICHSGGFEDSPDSEYISGGTSAKEANAMALGRQGNYFHWGYAAPPHYLTPEAQTVLANAIVYISKFKGKGVIARKFGANKTTYDIVGDKSKLSDRARNLMNEYIAIMTEQTNALVATARAKKERGEQLTPMDEALVNMGVKPPKALEMEEWLSTHFSSLYKQFGADLNLYRQYYNENMDYFYSDSRGNVTVDEDIKSLRIKKGDVKLLDVAIGMFEKGQDVDKAKRILNRYTLATFTTPSEWRNWFEQHKGKFFFTEAGGYYFMINSDKPVEGNDYHKKQKVSAYGKIATGETTDQEPVSVATAAIPLENGNYEIVVKLKIHPGYHIYSHVSEKDPFIKTEIGVTPPAGYTAVGKMKVPVAILYNPNSTSVYKGEAIFVQEVTGQGMAEAICQISYQCCNENICYPPVDMNLKVKLNPIKS